MPRNPDEEPRVPSLYTKEWKGEPDALLALVSRVLRLESTTPPRAKTTSPANNLTSTTSRTSPAPKRSTSTNRSEQAPRPAVDPKELDRYRRAFRTSSRRGQTFIAAAKDPTLAGWAFTYLLRLVEELGSHHVDLNGLENHLCTAPAYERSPLTSSRSTFAGTNATSCASPQPERTSPPLFATVRGTAQETPSASTPSRTHGQASSSPYRPMCRDPRQKTSGSTRQRRRVAGGLRRTRELEHIDEAALRLDVGWLERSPWPTIVGRADFADRVHSQAWALLAFAAPAGYAPRRHSASSSTTRQLRLWRFTR